MTGNEILSEFILEAVELLDGTESLFLSIEKGERQFSFCYDAIFRAFHSVKGTAAMFGLDELQSHMHKLETLFQSQKKSTLFEAANINHFLVGIDIAKLLLTGKEFPLKYFNYNVDSFAELPILISESKEKIPNGIIKPLGPLILPIEPSFEIMNKTFIQKINLAVDDIDPQHEKLFQMILDLKKALINNETKKEINLKILNDLEFYTDAHFKYEEAMLEHYGYSELNEHKILHDNFMLEIARVEQDIMNKKAASTVKLLGLLYNGNPSVSSSKSSS